MNDSGFSRRTPRMFPYSVFGLHRTLGHIRGDLPPRALLCLHAAFHHRAHASHTRPHISVIV